MEEDNDDGKGEERSASAIASELAQIKEAVLNAAGKRSRLPQPLFWSAFHSRISEVKRKKELARAVQEILGSIES